MRIFKKSFLISHLITGKLLPVFLCKNAQLLGQAKNKAPLPYFKHIFYKLLAF